MLFGCIDMGGTKSITAVINEKGEILARRQFPTIKGDPNAYFKLCSENLNAVTEGLGVNLRSLTGVGVCAPGMFDYVNGTLLMGPGTGWMNVNVLKAYVELLGIERIAAESDVRCATIAEAYFGNIRDLLWLTVSTGIGGAIIMDGRIVPGANFCSAELGHNKVEFEHPRPCNCGQKGCAEAHASGPAIDKAVRDLSESDPKYKALFIEKSLCIDAAGCSVLAREGEPNSIKIFNEAGKYLGRALAHAINILNPKCIYIGGGVSRSLDLMICSIREEIENGVVPFSRNTPVSATALGYNASLLGTMVLVLIKYNLINGMWIKYPDRAPDNLH